MADLLSTEGLRSALAGEFRAAVEAVIGRGLTAAEAPPATGSGWATPVSASGALEGTVTVWVDDAGVRAIAKAMLGGDEAPEPTVAADLLRQLFSQAAAATALEQGFEGVMLSSGAPARGLLPGGAAGVALMDGGTAMVVLTFEGRVTRPAGDATPGARAAAGSGAAPGAYPGNLAALLDIDLPLVVRFARTEMSLRSLAQLGPGSMVDMGRSPDAPVQLLIGSQVIAEGEVVVVSGNYGVRITSLVSPADRLKAMEL